MSPQNNNTLSYRVGELEKDTTRIDKNVYQIMTNHLPHLSSEMMSLKTRVTVSTVINVGAIIATAVIVKLFL